MLILKHFNSFSKLLLTSEYFFIFEFFLMALLFPWKSTITPFPILAHMSTNQHSSVAYIMHFQ